MTKNERDKLVQLVAKIKALETDVRNLNAAVQVSNLRYEEASRYKADSNVFSDYRVKHRLLNGYDSSGTPIHLPLAEYVRR